MKRKLNVVIIGAGSASFGPITLYDLCKNALVSGSSIGLVDINEEAVVRMTAVAERLVAHLGHDISVRGSVDRHELLPEADLVIIAAEEDRIERWRRDWEIPFRFGIQHTLGENRGPSGLSHTLRTVPLVLAMCSDIERYAPHATVLVMTNPEDRIAYAIQKYTSLRAYGYCDGLWDFKHNLVEKLIGIPGDRLFVEAAGINHAVWITQIVDFYTGEDLYPRFLETAMATGFQPFGRHLYERFGLWPHENDEHYGEYFHYAHEFMACEGYDFDAHLDEDRQWRESAAAMLANSLEMDAFVKRVAENAWNVLGDTPPSLTIKGLFGPTPLFVQNANLQNNGTIPGLPDDMIVETPGVAVPSGLKPVGRHKLNDRILQFLHREGVIQRLAAEAAYEGSREKALLALELDPHVATNRMAGEILDAFLDEHGDYIPWKNLQGLKG